MNTSPYVKPVITTNGPAVWYYGLEHLTLSPLLQEGARYLVWRGNRIADFASLDTSIFIHTEVFDLAAKCLYLERHNIVPTVTTLAMLDRYSSMALNIPGQRYLLIYSLETFARTPFRLMPLSIQPTTITNDLSEFDDVVEIELGSMKMVNDNCHHYVCPIFTKEGLKKAARSVTINSLSRFPSQYDFDEPEFLHLRSNILMALNSINTDELPLEASAKELLLAPYLLFAAAKSNLGVLTKTVSGLTALSQVGAF